MLIKNNFVDVCIVTLILFGINILGHFIPFERAIISPDTFTFIGDRKFGLSNFLLRPDRPLEYIIHEFEHYIFGYNFSFYFYYLLFSVLVLTSTIYLFFNLFFTPKISFLLVILYILLPFKTEIYHSSIYAWINIVDSMYIASLGLFILYTKQKLKVFFILSIFLYSFAILSRESGFFIPIIFICYLYFYTKNKNLFDYFKLLLPYFSLIIIDLIYRFTGAFSYTKNTGREILLQNIPGGIFDFFHIFFGRYLFKNILNGFHQFFSLGYVVVFILIITNILILYLLRKKLEIHKISKSKHRDIIFFLLVIFFSVLPNIINGSFGGRSVIIASIGVCVLLIYIFRYLALYSNLIIYFLLFSFFVISQGNSLAHVVSLRIPNAIYEFALENTDNLNNYNNIIVDTKSFAENIQYTLLDLESFSRFRENYNKYNILNTYMGAQSFESWGITAMIRYALKNKDINLLITTEDILSINKKLLSAIYINAGYNNKFIRKEIAISSEDTFIINYNKVYEKGYYTGNRKE